MFLMCESLRFAYAVVTTRTDSAITGSGRGSPAAVLAPLTALVALATVAAAAFA